MEVRDRHLERRLPVFAVNAIPPLGPTSNMAYLDSSIESRWVGLSFSSSAWDPRGRDSTRIYGL